MIILRCRSCNGTGQVTNEQYVICQALKSHATKRYFHLPMDEAAGDEREPPGHDACNGVPEKVECPICEGAGEIEFDEEDWELKVVADEDEQLEE